MSNYPDRQPKPMFEPTINYGHVLTAVSFSLRGRAPTMA